MFLHLTNGGTRERRTTIAVDTRTRYDRAGLRKSPRKHIDVRRCERGKTKTRAGSVDEFSGGPARTTAAVPSRRGPVIHTYLSELGPAIAARLGHVKLFVDEILGSAEQRPHGKPQQRPRDGRQEDAGGQGGCGCGGRRLRGGGIRQVVVGGRGRPSSGATRRRRRRSVGHRFRSPETASGDGRSADGEADAFS